jgi:hypothetical protein
MVNTNAENGHEETENSSSKLLNGVALPENDSYQQSLYIAAISKSLGYDGLVSPAIDGRESIATVFDFFYEEDEQFFKVFKKFDEEKFDKYLNYPAEPILILESDGIDCQMASCECGCTEVLVVDKALAERIYDNPRVFIHVQGSLWEYKTHVDGKWIWTERTPFLIRELMDSEEDEDDSEG